GAHRTAQHVHVAALAAPQIGRAEAEGDAVDGRGEEERELAKRDRVAVDLDVRARRLEDGARAVRAGEGRDDEPGEEPRRIADALLLTRVVHAEVVDRRAEAQDEPVLDAVHAEEVALGRLVDPTAAVVADDAGQYLLRPAAPSADRFGDVVDGA